MVWHVQDGRATEGENRDVKTVSAISLRLDDDISLNEFGAHKSTWQSTSRAGVLKSMVDQIPNSCSAEEGSNED